MPDRFSVFVQALVGPSDGPGEEAFNVRVCSPSWLAEQRRPKGFEFVRATLVLDKWDPQLARRAIGDLCLHATGETWHEIARSLTRYMDWEFDHESR